MALTNISQPGLNQGQPDALAGFLKVFSGEVISAFERSALAVNNHLMRTISSGKSASFPVMGRAKAYEAIVKGDPMPAPGIPESLNVLLHELRGLGLSINLE